MTAKDFPTAILNVSHLMDVWLPWKMKFDHIPGLVVGISYKGKLLTVQSFGYSNLEKKTLMTNETKFHIASISKTFTATAIMQLAEQKKLHLDDKIVNYIPWFKPQKKNIKDITIRQLLSHSAGLFRDGDTPHWNTGEFPEFLENSFSAKTFSLKNPSHFKYSNYGYALLGLIIQQVSGLPYNDYVRKNIIKPLKLTSTSPDFTGDEVALATGYTRHLPDRTRTAFPHYQTKAYSPATGFISNAADLIKFFTSFNSSLLTEKSKILMMHGYEKIENEDQYGLGLEITNIKGRKIIGHSGVFQGFITESALDPKNELGIVVLSNCLGNPAGSILSGLLESIYTFVDEPKLFISKKKISSTQYEGFYRSIWSDSLIVSFSDVLISFPPQTNYPLRKLVKLEPTNINNQFIIKTKNGYSETGEMAEFSNCVSNKLQTIVWGANSSERVNN